MEVEVMGILPEYQLTDREVAHLGLFLRVLEEQQHHEDQEMRILPQFRFQDREVAYLGVFLDVE